jgi:ribosomal-protein-alanine N-acetyltransferase
MNLWSPELKQMLTPEIKVQLLNITEADLEAVLAVEQSAYSHPWTLGNFKDALKAGNVAHRLVVQEQLVGYFVAMQVIDEVHLLNITVAPPFRRQGWARCLMQALSVWSHAKGASWLWLEVRESNAPALNLYKSLGFQQVGLRKDYYPAGRTTRESAVVMSMSLKTSQ